MKAVDNLTLALDGEVSLAAFAKAVRNLSALVDALSAHVAKDVPVEWAIDDLRAGSATTTAWGSAPVESERVADIVRAYVQVGRALNESPPLFPFPISIERPAREISSLLNGAIESIRFESPEDEVTLRTSRQRVEKSRSAYGALTGIVETLQRHRGLRFTLYDQLFGRGVSCYLTSGQEELMRDIWGKQATVEGWVTRDAVKGYPTAIRRITRITEVEHEPGDYRAARGVLPMSAGMMPAEDAIRRLRDD